jgi:ABC-2 type transport system ATP-binding protein
VIRFSAVSFAYAPGERVLAGVDLDLGPGLTLLVGPNGCGKSTLLKLAAGVERPVDGAIAIDGRDLWVEEAAARRTLAYLPEQHDLTPYATLHEVLALVCRLRGEPLTQAGTALGQVGLARQAHLSVRQLSLGQRRRALLAAALIGAPSHLLLDEPLEALDLAARDAVLSWLDGRLAGGALALVASHDLETFAPRTRRALTLQAGSCHLVPDLPADPAARRSLLERLARGTIEPSSRLPAGA